MISWRSAQRMQKIKRNLKATEWMACVFGVTAAFCAAIGEAMQFSVYALVAVFMFVLSGVK